MQMRIRQRRFTGLGPFLRLLRVCTVNVQQHDLCSEKYLLLDNDSLHHLNLDLDLDIFVHLDVNVDIHVRVRGCLPAR